MAAAVTAPVTLARSSITQSARRRAMGTECTAHTPGTYRRSAQAMEIRRPAISPPHSPAPNTLPVFHASGSPTPAARKPR